MPGVYLTQLLDVAIGRGDPSKQLTAVQMAARAVVAYAVALVMVRVARRRFLGRNSAMDVIAAVTFGSALSRGMTGNSPLGPVLAACGALVGVDWLLAAIGARWDRFDRWVKGCDVELVRDGRVLREVMRGQAISDRDLAESLRLQGKTTDVAGVARAGLERNGTVSVIPAGRPPPRVVEVRVEAGVQTVRIELPA